MKLTQTIVICVALGATFVGIAQAQEWPKRKPGLWETTMTSSGAEVNSKMDARFANMPPEKRAQMEEAMKRRGITIGRDGVTQTVRFCLTPEEVAQEAHKNLIERFQRDSSKCQDRILSRTSTEVRFHATCRNEQGAVSEIDGRLYDLSPETASIDFTGKSPTKGEFRLQHKEHWVAANCGSVQ